jgi:hypothetical protein
MENYQPLNDLPLLIQLQITNSFNMEKNLRPDWIAKPWFPHIQHERKTVHSNIKFRRRNLTHWWTDYSIHKGCIDTRGRSMGGREVDHPPETQKREERKRKKWKKKKTKENRREKRKNGKNISIFVYSAFLFTWVDPFGEGRSCHVLPGTMTKGLIFLVSR